jgi:hypothetical protein
MIVRYLSFLIGLLIASTAHAQQSQPQMNPLEQSLNQEWGAFQLSQQHVSTVIVKIVEDWKKDKETLTLERAYWADYVKGLSEKSQSMVSPKKE